MIIKGALTLGSVALYCVEAWLSLLPNHPLARTHIAPAVSGPEPSHLLYICHHVMARCSTVENNRENMTETLLPLLPFWLFGLFCLVLVIDGPLTVLDFLIIEGGVILMVCSTHTSQTNWTLWVKCALAFKWWLSVSVPLLSNKENISRFCLIKQKLWISMCY